MVEVIHEHDSGAANNSNGIIMLLGILVMVGIFLFFFYFFGRNIMSGFNTGTTTPQVNIPDKMDVNVNQK